MTNYYKCEYILCTVVSMMMMWRINYLSLVANMIDNKNLYTVPKLTYATIDIFAKRRCMLDTTCVPIKTGSKFNW